LQGQIYWHLKNYYIYVKKMRKITTQETVLLRPGGLWLAADISNAVAGAEQRVYHTATNLSEIWHPIDIDCHLAAVYLLLITSTDLTIYHTPSTFTYVAELSAKRAEFARNR